MNFARLLTSLLGSAGGGALGGMIGGRTGRMIGSLAGSMLGGRGMRGAGGLLGGLGGMLGGGDDRQEAATMDNAAAEVLVQAMVNSAKSDGEVDQSEVDAIIGQLGQLDDGEEQYLRSELASPFRSANDVASSVPNGLENQVYAVSMLVIDVDSDAERAYLGDLANQLGISDATVSEIHSELGIDSL